MGLIRTLLGQRFADFNPDHLTPADFWRVMIKAKMHLDKLVPRPINRIFAPTVAESNKVVRLGEEDLLLEPGFIRTLHPANGGIVEGDLSAVAFFTADCPIVCLYDDQQLAVLYARYTSLVPAESAQPSIVEVAIRHFIPSRTRAWIGYGIGPCCAALPGQEIQRLSHLLQSRFGLMIERCLSSTSDTCPYGVGHVSINLFRLAFSLLLSVGVQPEKIKTDLRCTCCLRQNDSFLYWSNARFQGCGGLDGRNLALCWLDSTVTDDWPAK